MADDSAGLFLAGYHLLQSGVTAVTADYSKSADMMENVPRLLEYDTEWVWNAGKMRTALLLKDAEVKLWMSSEQLA